MEQFHIGLFSCARIASMSHAGTGKICPENSIGSFCIRAIRFRNPERIPLLALVVLILDSAIHWINHYPALDADIRETNYDFHWIGIYPVDSVVHFSNNWGLNSR